MSKKRRTTSYVGYSEAVKRFDIEPSPGRERNRFRYIDRGRDTFNAGQLIPFMWFPILPGDDLYFSPRFLVRLSNAFISPVMDEVSCDVYAFMSYNSFVFDEWKEFMGEYEDNTSDYDESGENVGGDAILEPPYNSPGDYELPTMTFNKLASPGNEAADSIFPIDSLYDHLGLPYRLSPDGTSITIQTLVPRHCNLIWNEFFREQNFQRRAPVPRSIGPDKYGQFKVMPVLKHRDYFTGSLPFLQKGPNVLIGLQGDLPVIFDYPTSIDPSEALAGVPHWYNTSTGQRVSYSGDAGYVLRAGIDGSTKGSVLTNATTGSSINVGTHAYADASGLQALALAQIRLGFQLQRFYEGQARSGTRYIEYVHFMFGVYVPDLQIERPQFIGGTRFYINVNPVTQTSNTSGQNSALGSLAAFGVAYHRDDGAIHCKSLQHGYVILFICARTNLSYSQGLDRDWSKRDRFDFYTPTLAHLVEQPILNQEICATGIPAYDEEVFGYVPRYDEYRTIIPRNKGRFRPDAPGSLASYHFGELFDISTPGTEADNFPGLPHLNPKFLTQSSDVINRSLNLPSTTTNVPQFLMDYTVKVHGSRVMSKYGIPGFADHF